MGTNNSAAEMEDENSLKDYIDELNEEILSLKKDLEDAAKKAEEYFDMLSRTAAEFDNYKKRTRKEKDVMRADVVCDTVNSFIPVVDNLERAVLASENDCDLPALKDGLNMVINQMKDVLDCLGVEEIEALGQKFDANLHEAVIHVEDENHDENEIIEVFQKGYMAKGKVIRHSVVKVAN